MDDHWRDTVELRGIDTWDSISYPPNAPLTSRPDWRQAGADTEPAKAAKETLDRFGFAHAICNSLFPVQILPRREPGRRLRPRAQRLAGGRMAGQGPAPAGLGRAAHPVGRAIGGGDRAAGRRQAFRAGADAGDGRASARQVDVLADLCRRRAPWLHRRHPRRQQLSPRADRLGLAHLLPRGLRRPVAGLPRPARQPHLRGRVRQIPQAQGCADRIRRDLAAALSVAPLQVLARRAQRGALDRPLAGGIRARSRPPHDPTL